METRTCPACQSPLREEDTFCPRCGGAATSTAVKKRGTKWLWILAGVVLGCPTAIVLLGVLATLVIPKVMKDFRIAGVEKAKTDITQIVNALNEYAIRNQGKYPDSLEALVQPDQSGYRFLHGTTVPRDPWKHEYVYEPPHSGSGNPDPRVWSHGKDGQPGGGDDIDSRTMSDER